MLNPCRKPALPTNFDAKSQGAEARFIGAVGKLEERIQDTGPRYWILTQHGGTLVPYVWPYVGIFPEI